MFESCAIIYICSSMIQLHDDCRKDMYLYTGDGGYCPGPNGLVSDDFIEPRVWFTSLW